MMNTCAVKQTVKEAYSKREMDMRKAGGLKPGKRMSLKNLARAAA